MVIIVWSLWYIWAAVRALWLLFLFGQSVQMATVFDWFETGLPGLGLGIVCFACADWIAGLSYRREVAGSLPESIIGFSAKEMFGLIVRVAGIAVFLYGGYYLIYGCADAAGLSKQDSPGEMRDDFVFGIPAALFGLAMVGGASLVVNFSYHLSDKRPKENQEPVD